MTDSLGKLNVRRKSGQEHFHNGQDSFDFTVLDFWQWSTSDFVSNTTRGILAEYVVACDLGVTDQLRLEWAPYDLETQDGTRVEVKSAAYVQIWHQPKLTSIEFAIQPTRRYDYDSGRYDIERKRQADIYVFALLNHQDRATVDPLNVTQWDFYILPTSELDQKLPMQKDISIRTLLSLNPLLTKFGSIRTSIEQMMTSRKNR